MKKHILFSASIFLAATTLTVAQITDAGFENWTVGAPCSDLNEWNTANSTTGTLAGMCSVTQETADPHSGSSAVTLTTIQIPLANQPIPGAVTTGIIDVQNLTVSGGLPFTDRPTSFSGWYQGAPLAADSYSFAALLINENTGDTVGTAGFTSSATVSTWTQFTAPVTYSSPDNPTIVQILLLSSDQTNPIEGSVAKFDHLSYETLTVGIEDVDADLIKTYPNPVVESVFFNTGSSETAVVSIFNVLGTKVLEHSISSSNTGICMSHLPAGTYIWQFSNLEGKLLKTGKLIYTK
ncbi:T9SS type A sorting domain-containing protein [Flavobacteriales bacterium]|nr:T9SS type A sorting domain-containing protein [Flavobacteriales bacterium]